ncbi:SIMPL domain-containing protein [Bacillus thuringiensis]|uniref:SIMPL domain-containing protein n=1 Tax=Bacillus thuringiensis TaxID=1428 RepID=UPI0021D65637|nr:SIMPL domain-containing protein [Bacillus thuringiensis]MCU7667245.1 SIMPL domain-containing protein [Bacillus thuringiensis]
MNYKILGGIVLCSFGLLAITVLGTSDKQPIVIDGKNYSPDNTITVVGTGNSKMKADTGYLYADVTVEHKDSKEAQQLAADTMDELYNSLRQMGIGNKNVETMNYSIDMVRDYKQKPPYPIKAYRVQNSIKITIDDMKEISDVIDNVANSPYVSVNNLAFDLADKEKAENEAIESATDNAEQKAKLIAKKLGVHIQGIKSVEILKTNNGGENIRMPYSSMSDSANKSVSTPISAQNIKTATSVEVKFLVD